MSTTILSIESSCDETAAAIVVDGREVKSNIIYSQIELHKLYGGVGGCLCKEETAGWCASYRGTHCGELY